MKLIVVSKLLLNPLFDKFDDWHRQWGNAK